MPRLNFLQVGNSSSADNKFGRKVSKDFGGSYKSLEDKFFSDEKEWTFYETADSIYSSFSKPVSSDAKFVAKERPLKGLKIDSVMPNFNNKWNYLKVDVRGYGVNVLLGASNSLDKHFWGVEVVDFNDASEYAGAKGMKKSEDYLVAKGFECRFKEGFADKNGKELSRKIFIKKGTPETEFSRIKKMYGIK